MGGEGKHKAGIYTGGGGEYNPNSAAAGGTKFNTMDCHGHGGIDDVGVHSYHRKCQGFFYKLLPKRYV